jgi:type IV pilus assembly protein PilB
MSETRIPTQEGLALPDTLHASRIEELERLWDVAVNHSEACFDGSAVKLVDSQGLTFLLDGIDKLSRAGTLVRIDHASPTLSAVRRALRLAERLPLNETAEDHSQFQGQRLGEILVALEFIRQNDFDLALEEAKSLPNTYIGQVLIQKGLIGEDALGLALAHQHGLPFVKPVQDQFLDVTLSTGIPLADLRSHGALPFLKTGDTLAVALHDPSDVFALDVVRECTGLRIVPSVATESEIQAGLDRVQRSLTADSQSHAKHAGQIPDDINAEERFNRIMVTALIEGASDLHIEPEEDGWLLRYRIDGKLRDVERLSPGVGRALCARIKVLADCDISEKRLPQDGRIRFQDGNRDVDLRVNTLPTVYGEKAVMRVLDRKSENLSLEKLGLAKTGLEQLREAIHAPHGLVLVTGPTGSGKTTTLYSVLHEIMTPELNISTVENPVERTLDGINQTQVNFKAGLGFDTCLRALLRQDPDILMIGEIRDGDTAKIAVEAALTGHLVLATLHTNDASSAASRLTQMGVEPFLIAATLRTVMAQRLVRRLCDACKSPVQHKAGVLKKYADFGLENSTHFQAVGCVACRGTGYAGRCGVFEVMNIKQKLQDALAENLSAREVRQLALQEGMDSLLADAIGRVQAGQTTLEEALRAGGSG